MPPKSQPATTNIKRLRSLIRLVYRIAAAAKIDLRRLYNTINDMNEAEYETAVERRESKEKA